MCSNDYNYIHVDDMCNDFLSAWHIHAKRFSLLYHLDMMQLLRNIRLLARV